MFSRSIIAFVPIKAYEDITYVNHSLVFIRILFDLQFSLAMITTLSLLFEIQLNAETVIAFGAVLGIGRSV